VYVFVVKEFFYKETNSADIITIQPDIRLISYAH